MDSLELEKHFRKVILITFTSSPSSTYSTLLDLIHKFTPTWTFTLLITRIMKRLTRDELLDGQDQAQSSHPISSLSICKELRGRSKKTVGRRGWTLEFDVSLLWRLPYILSIPSISSSSTTTIRMKIRCSGPRSFNLNPVYQLHFEKSFIAHDLRDRISEKKTKKKQKKLCSDESSVTFYADVPTQRLIPKTRPGHPSVAKPAT